MSLPPLSVAIGADTKGLEGGLANATSLLKRFAGPAAVGGAIAALRGMTRAGMENIDAQAKLARAVGGTTVGLQALARAGDRAGVQTSELQSATTRLNQRLGQVISTGKGAEDTFKALGLNAQQLANMDIDERFMAISNAMRDAGMSSQEMSFHLRELGIRQASVISLIQGGAEEIERSRQAVVDFGVAVSEVDAASIERANDALSEVGRVFEGLRNQMAVRMAPSIEAVANAFTAMAREGGPVYNLIRGFVEQLPRITSYLTAAAAGLATYTGVLVAAAAAKAAMALAAQGLRVALLRLGFPALIIAAGEMLHQFSRLTQATGGWGNALEALGDLASAVWDGIKTSAGSIVPALSAVWQDVRAAFFGLLEALTQRWADFLRTLGAGVSGIPGMEDAFLALHGASVRAQSDVYGFSQAIDEANEASGRFRKEAADNFTAGGEKISSALQNLRDIMNNADEEIYGGGGDPAPSAEGGSGGGGEGGGGGGGGLADKLRERLETLQTGLMTEAEVLEAWYQESLETLQEARARELITEEEYWEQKARLQQEYNQRSQGMMREELQMRQQTFSAMMGLLQQFGQRSKVAAKAAVVLSAAQRVSEIMASTAAAAMSAAAATPGGPAAKMAAAARVSAYGKVQAGIAAASAALRLGGGSSGGGGAASSGGAAAAAGGGGGQAQNTATQRIRFEVAGEGAAADASFRTLQLVQQALDNGGRLDGIVAERVAG